MKRPLRLIIITLLPFLLSCSSQESIPTLTYDDYSYDGSDSGSDYSKIYEPYEMVNIAIEKYKSESFYCAVAVGQTDASIVTQTIKALHIKNDSRYFEESISNGIVSIYDRMWEEGNETKTRWGDNSDYASTEEKSMSNDEYVKLMGRKVSDLSSYTINANTVLLNESKSGKANTSARRINGGYIVELELDPDTAVENYKTQMQTISSLWEKPTFSYCHLTFRLDDSLHLLSSTSYEKYHAQMNFLIGSDCTGELNTKYQWGKEIAIPELESTDDYYDGFESFVTGEIA